MSKSIKSYPQEMRQKVIDRRMRQYTISIKNKEPIGIGTWAAKAAYDKRLMKDFQK